jgi:hypothetical protein
VGQRLPRTDPLLRLALQEEGDELRSLRTDEGLVLVLARADLHEELLLVVRLEGTVPVQHRVQQDAQRPAVGQEGTVGAPADHLRRHVGGRAAELGDGGSGVGWVRRNYL